MGFIHARSAFSPIARAANKAGRMLYAGRSSLLELRKK
jgi:hypothetical protein